MRNFSINKKEKSCVHTEHRIEYHLDFERKIGLIAVKEGKESTRWKKGFSKIISKKPEINQKITFESIETGEEIFLQECLYNDLLPQSVKSSPISSLSGEDNLWIATSMLNRVSDNTDNVVIIEKEYPSGIIGTKEILRGILKNPTLSFFDNTLSQDIMNRKFYLDTRNAKLSKILSQMNLTNQTFSIIQNSKYDFSSISYRELLEIGSMSQIEGIEELETKEKTATVNRDNSVQDILKLLTQDGTELVQLDGESLILDRQTVVQNIVTKLNFLENVDDFLELNATIFQFQPPKLIPDNLAFPEVCKLMLDMKFPYLITSKRIWTSLDVMEILSKGAV